MKNHVFKRICCAVAVVMCIGAAAPLTGCASGKPAAAESQSAYAHAVDALNVLWDNLDEQFPAFGGNFEHNVENAPGDLDLNDTDTMTSALLIPEDVQSKVSEAATLFHMMNANTFTGAALKLNGMSTDEAAGKIKDAFKNNQFMCGMPDAIVIYTGGNDVVYFFGASDILDSFKKAAEANLEGFKLAAEENY